MHVILYYLVIESKSKNRISFDPIIYQAYRYKCAAIYYYQTRKSTAEEKKNDFQAFRFRDCLNI